MIEEATEQGADKLRINSRCGWWPHCLVLVPDVRDRQQGYFPLGEWEKCLICVSGR